MYKFVTFSAALYIAFNRKGDLEKKFEYLNRIYPEPTELQKTLYKEALTFKENEWNQRSI
jgi:hypothetical protein